MIVFAGLLWGLQPCPQGLRFFRVAELADGKGGLALPVFKEDGNLVSLCMGKLRVAFHCASPFLVGRKA